MEDTDVLDKLTETRKCDVCGDEFRVHPEAEATTCINHRGA